MNSFCKIILMIVKNGLFTGFVVFKPFFMFSLILCNKNILSYFVIIS